MSLAWIKRLARDAQIVLAGIIDEYLKTDQLQDYRPYPKQAEYHQAGRLFTNRLLRAGNQNGKTLATGAECAMHLTGEYPTTWKGKRFTRPITLWATGETGEAVRDGAQRVLLGRPKQIGTGMIPKRCLSSMYGRAKGVADLYDYYMIKHVSGGYSMVKFRYYAQDREAWQGPPVDVVWFDEEPPMDKYAEGLARTIAVRGITMLSFTPLKGYSAVVNLYLKDPDPERSGRHDTHMTIKDALHITEAAREAEMARWPKHEQRARLQGEPALGEGLIYQYDEDDYVIAPIPIPEHWVYLGALDFGITHPTAAVLVVWDREADVVYVVKEYRRKGLTPAEHWLTLKRWGDDLKWAWPRDGLNKEKGTGKQATQLYKEEGAKMLSLFAQFKSRKRKKRGGEKSGDTPSSAVSVESGIIQIQMRLESNRFKVFSTCTKWLEEMRVYHRVDGQIVKETDDLLDATRYAIMMLRFADRLGQKPTFRVRNDYDWQAGV